jgi:PAS domain S-box-containing protein
MDSPQKNSTIIIISLLTIVTGIVVLAGWLLNSPGLANMVIGYIAMRFNTGLCFVLFGSALLFSQYQTKKYSNPGFLIATLLGTAIAFLTIYQDIFHVNIGIDQLFVTDKTPVSSYSPFPGRMATTSSACFFLLGIGLLLLINKGRVFHIAAQYVFHVVTFISGVALIGNMYGVALFLTLLYVTSMPTCTALLLFIISLAASLLNPSLGLSRVFTGQQVGNKMAKRLFSLMVLMVLLFGMLNGEMQHSRLFSSLDTGMSVLAVCFLLVSLLLVWNTATWLNKIDTQRTEAEAKVKMMNAELEQRVKDQTSELREAELKFRTIAERSMVGVYIVQNDVFTYVNPRFANVFGYEPDEMLNDSSFVYKIFHESYLDTVRENVRRRIEGELESVRYEAMGKRKDGTTNWIEIYGNRVLIGGKPAIIGSMIDISERRKAEEELRSSEQKYKLLFESSPMPMWMIAKDDLSIIAVNDATARLYGYNKDELLHMNVKVLRTPEDAAGQLDDYTAETEEYRIVRHLKKDGSVMIVQIIAHDIIFEGRPVRLSLTNDITEKIEAEEALQKSEANLQAILNTTDTAYALFDKDLRVLTFNQKAIEFVKSQYDHTPQKNDRLADYFPKQRFPEFSKFANGALKGNNINYEIDYPQPDGSVFWYYVRLFPITDENKQVLGMLMALYDITERKNAEEDLKTAYKHIQSHINSIKEMAWKQSHLIRSPLANLKGLAAMLDEGHPDPKVIDHIQSELDRLDSIIIEMAEDASENYND